MASKTAPLPAPLTLDDINRSQISRDADVDLSHVSRVFSGERRPSINLMDRICKSLSGSLDRVVTLDELMLLLVTINPGMYQTKGKVYERTAEGRPRVRRSLMASEKEL